MKLSVPGVAYLVNHDVFEHLDHREKVWGGGGQQKKTPVILDEPGDGGRRIHSRRTETGYRCPE
jgi:hypothetical protein